MKTATRDAPWDIDRPGTQFAVACDLEIFPNLNNVVHLAFMAIYPKTFNGNETITRQRALKVISRLK